MNDTVHPLPSSQPAETRRHRTDAVEFALPVELKDKTAHVFTLSDDGPSEFNVVVSHAAASPSDTLNDIAERLVNDLSRALPKFSLERRREARLGGSPSVELFFGWNNNGVAMQQRQAIVLVESAAVEGKPDVLMVAGTCLNSFSDKWHARFDELLAGMTLRRPWPPVRDAAAAEPLHEVVPETAAPEYGFALSQDGTLQVLASVEALTAQVPAREVEAGMWKFYDGDGRALEVRWDAPKSRGLIRRPSPTHYRLASATETSGLGPLQHRLALVERVVGELQSPAQLQLHLRRRAPSAVSASRLPEDRNA